MSLGEVLIPTQDEPGARHAGELKISMEDGKELSLEQIRAFIKGSEGIGFSGEDRGEVYRWLDGLLCRHEYWNRPREEKGLPRVYAGKMTGLSRAQITRLIARYLKERKVAGRRYRRHRFGTRYTLGDVELLAAVDEAHETLSGSATRRILEREFTTYKQRAYVRLAGISVAHLYNLRKRREYREKRLRYEKTKGTGIGIGERRRPRPEGRPGYLRVDTVHQGDSAVSGKGVYHVNTVDEVTQWEVLGAVGQISEQWLQPLLAAMLAQYPFQILGFHSDNGSEYINHQVAGMLNKLLIEQTKSRPRHSNDNGLAESKNGAVIRKLIGYGYIAPEHAGRINEFYQQHLNLYLNFHRPCAQAEVKIDDKGKQKRVYKKWATPWEVFAAMPKAADYLKKGQTLAQLDQLAQSESDTACARRMQTARQKLFSSIRAAGKSA